MTDPFEASLLDDQALAEIEMTSQLMIAASHCVGHLSQHEVDEILGIVAAG